MKNATTQLKNFLASCTTFVRLHLLSITLSGGTVLRYTDYGSTITFNGQTYYPLAFSWDSLRQSKGLSVDSLSIKVQQKVGALVNNVSLASLALKNGLRGAVVQVERVIAADWLTFKSTGAVGSVVIFAGRVSETPSGSESQFEFSVASWTELLDTDIPNEQYSASCKNTVYDAKCGLLAANFKTSGVIAAGATKIKLVSNLAASAGYYDLGYVIMTSGQNNGQKRSVRLHEAGGYVTLVAPLPFLPATGDTFDAYAGCNLTTSICSSRFNNLLKFRGEPYIPSPETAV